MLVHVCVFLNIGLIIYNIMYGSGIQCLFLITSFSPHVVYIRYQFSNQMHFMVNPDLLMKLLTSNSCFRCPVFCSCYSAGRWHRTWSKSVTSNSVGRAASERVGSM